MFRMCAAMLGAAALVAGGCGSDDSSSSEGDSKSTAATPLTKAQYVARATAVCKGISKAEKPVDDQIDALPKNADGTAALDAIGPILAAALKITSDGVVRLRAIGAPSADKPAIDAYYAKLDRIIDVQDNVGKAAQKGDRDAAKQAGASLDGLLSSADSDAKRIGIPACADAF
jgi:hypothetical protein